MNPNIILREYLCNLKLFLNGKQVDSKQMFIQNCQFISSQAQKLVIGQPPSSSGGISGYYYTGQIDEIRISQQARYTTDFSIPAVPFSTDQSTSLLMHLDGNTNDSAFIN